jgi:hypothetical protein
MPEGTPVPPTTGTGGGGGTTTPAQQQDAIAAYQACRAGKPVLEKFEGCKGEYEKARDACAHNPLNPKCDSSICLGSGVGLNLSACPSYLTGIDAEVKDRCKAKTGPAKVACESEVRDKLERCKAVPNEGDCGINPNAKVLILRGICTTVPTRLECTALQIGCTATPNEPGCSELRAKCTQDPNRIDCKEASDFKQKCTQDPNRPECKDLPKAAKTLTAEEDKN